MTQPLVQLQAPRAAVPHRARRGLAPAVGAALLAFGLFAVLQLVVDRPMMIAERFLPGAGWVQAAALSAWAFVLARWMLDPRRQSRARRFAWGLFSFVFFSQLLLGVVGFDRFLMTGELHYPIPALIVAAPLYRGGGLFMLTLFAVTLLLVGPAWCSHLCYVGAWDSALANRRRRPAAMPRWRNKARVGVLVAVVVTALALDLFGVPPSAAGAVALAFGLAGVAIMFFVSRRTGVMTHCTTWCPTGVLATWLGKISPFRIRLRSACNACGACGLGCRYDALRPEDIERRRPGPTCTLCGDCVGRCSKVQVEYAFPGLGPEAARGLFIALVAGLHAVFLGVAMI